LDTDKRIEELKKTIDEVVSEAVEPLKEQQNNWVNKITKEEKKVEEKQEKGLRAARIVRALAAAKGDMDKAIAYAKKNYDDVEVVKALAAGTDTAGGYLVPEEYSMEIIEFLRPQSVVRRMGATVVPMATGTLNIPAIAGGSQASYVGENSGISTQEPTFGNVQLTWKKLAAIVPISNDLLRFSNYQTDAIIRDDLVAAIAQKEDEAFIRGPESTPQVTPKGMRHWAHQGNVIPAAGVYNLATVTDDLGKLILALKQANVRFIRPGWLMAPRTEMFLMTLRDTNGNYAFRPEMFTGKLFGYPYAVTTQIPTNLGTGTNQNESEIYFVDFADAVIGEATQLIIDASSEASYTTSGGVLSAFAADQTLIRVIAEHDFAMRHDKSVAVLTGVKWGV